MKHRIHALTAALALTAVAGPLHAQIWEECNVAHSYLGEATGDSFGWVGLNAGDVDADGVNDVIVGAPGHRAGGGRAYVYSGATGLELFRFTGSAGERVGFAVGRAGDIDGDSFGDVIVGAPGAAGAPGRAYVLRGPDGQLALTLVGARNGDSFGSAVDGAGDVDGDGTVDLIVGASTDGTAGGNAGRIAVLSGADGSQLRSATGEGAGDQLGSSVAGLGDRDGDGFSDYMAGAPNAGPAGSGRAYVYTGVDGSLVSFLSGDGTSANYGQFFAGPCGDIDGNGDSDLFVSDFNNSALGPGTGRVFVYSGTDLAPLLTLTGIGSGHGFGIGRGWLGDWDGDGKDDLFFGSWTFGQGGRGRGEIRSGLDGRLLARFTGDIAGANLGFDAAGLGDVDGDGIPDVVLTAASQASNRGATHIITGAPRPPTRYCVSTPHSAGPGATIGYTQSTGIANNTLRLRVADAPPNKTGIFFYGATEIDAPFGDGRRCVGGRTYRIYPPLTLNANGIGLLPLDFTRGNPSAGPGMITPGSTWSFQFWFRDPTGPGGTGFNLSDGLRVTFCP